MWSEVSALISASPNVIAVAYLIDRLTVLALVRGSTPAQRAAIIRAWRGRER